MTGRELLDWMEQARITQTALAARLGVTPQMVHKLCKREAPLSGYWQARMEQVIAAVEHADRQRLAEPFPVAVITCPITGASITVEATS